MNVRSLGSWFFIALGLLPWNGLFAQGTRADYERAAALPRLYSGKVFKAALEPHWFANGTRLWYRNDLAEGAREFIVADALAGTRQPAFDHARVAAEMTRLLGREVRATHLPVDELEFDAAEPVVRLRGRESWEWNLASGELRRLDAGGSETNGLAEVRPSQRTGPETSVTFLNRTGDALELYWVNPEGQRVHYGTLAAGASRVQHTFGGHVWLLTRVDGRPVAAFEAADAGGDLVIDANTRTPRERRGGRAENRSRNRPERPAGFTSPDGKFTAFFRANNLHVRVEADGEEFALSTEGTAEDGYGGRVWWSPDSTRLLALRTRAGDDRKVYYVESSPKDQVQPKLHSYDYRKPGDRVPHPRPQLFHVPERRRIAISDELFPNPWSLTEFRWEPDSSRFTFLYNQRGHQVMRVMAVDAATGAARALVDEQPATFFCYSSKLFLRHLPATRELIWMSERDGWNHLYLYDAETGAVKNPITRGEWVVREVEHVDEVNRQVWLRVGGVRPGEDPYHVHLARVNFDGTGFTLLTDGDGTHTVKFSPDRRFFVDTWSRVDQPPVHELRRAADGALIGELERADIRELLKTGWRAPERFTAKGRDGVTDIYGIILRPTNFDPARKYPVIEDIYAGPHSAFVPKSFQAYYKMQSLAELGFILVKMDGMGTSHRSKAFHDVCWKNLGDSGFPDRIAWIKAAAAREPAMDLTRVGIYGGSAGGQSSTRALLAHGDFYQVAVSDCGCHDNRVDKIWWNEQWMGWPVGPHYAEQSNVTHAHRLTGKLLLIVGEMDENVDPASTLQVVNALIQADKDFDLLVMTGTGHGAAEQPYASRRRADFFVRHLLGVEPRRE